ncbi:hypothetical protein EVA_13088 [gut metagenome]|uniref:Uncharacterized protein n=1 Tax=gut metagenome TaxID=749906 RepID=J9CFK3_9ZZZZ
MRPSAEFPNPTSTWPLLRRPSFSALTFVLMRRPARSPKPKGLISATTTSFTMLSMK